MIRGSFFAATAGIVIVAYGCARDEDPVGPERVVDGGPDATTDPLKDAADAPEPADAETDAGPKCTNDGWCTTPLPRMPPLFGVRDIRDVWADPQYGVWAVANDDGEILRYQDDEWKIVYRLPTWRRFALSAITGDSTGRIVAVGGRLKDYSNGEMLILHSDDGETFEADVFDARSFGGLSWAMADRHHAMLFDVIATGPHEFLVGALNGIHRGDGAATWTHEYSAPLLYGTNTVYSLWGTADEVHGCGIALGDSSESGGNDGTLTYERTSVDGGPPKWSYKYTDVGACISGWRPDGSSESWMATTFDPTYGKFGVARRAPAVTQSGGQAPALLPRQDLVTGSAPFQSVWGRNTSDLWVVGGASAIFHFDGTAWKGGLAFSGTAPLLADFNAVAGLPTGESWIVGKNIALHRKAQP